MLMFYDILLDVKCFLLLKIGVRSYKDLFVLVGRSNFVRLYISFKMEANCCQIIHKIVQGINYCSYAVKCRTVTVGVFFSGN